MPVPRLHADQVDVDESLVRRLLTRQAPTYADRPLRLVDSGGTDNAVFRLGEELAVRLPLRPDAVSGLRKEIRWVPHLAPQLSLAVPEVVAVGEPAAGYPFPWAILWWIPGEDALTARITSLTSAAETLGRFVQEMQGITTPAVPRAGSEPGFVRGLPLVTRDEVFQDSLLRSAGLVDVDRIDAIWADALAAPDWAGAPVWLHADLIPGNLLLRDGRIVGVLDFGAMASGDPAYDITSAWHILDASSRSLFRDIVGVDDATWRRARGLVVSGGVIAFPYYLNTNPSMIATARRGIEQVLSEVD